MSDESVVLKSGLENRIKETLAELDQLDLKRELSPPTGIDLSSNDYLLLSGHPLIKERMAEAVLRRGVGSTASRLLRGHRDEFEEVEKRFAKFKRAEKALFFGSGYAANIAVLSTLIEKNDVVFSDALNHASIIDGLRL